MSIFGLNVKRTSNIVNTFEINAFQWEFDFMSRIRILCLYTQNQVVANDSTYV